MGDPTPSHLTIDGAEQNYSVANNICGMVSSIRCFRMHQPYGRDWGRHLIFTLALSLEEDAVFRLPYLSFPCYTQHSLLSTCLAQTSIQPPRLEVIKCALQTFSKYEPIVINQFFQFVFRRMARNQSTRLLTVSDGNLRRRGRKVGPRKRISLYIKALYNPNPNTQSLGMSIYLHISS